jgi:hypothetical protein
LQSTRSRKSIQITFPKSDSNPQALRNCRDGHLDGARYPQLGTPIPAPDKSQQKSLPLVTSNLVFHKLIATSSL